MKGLLLFVAGLLCGGAAVAWLFLGREEAPTPVVESTLPAPRVGPEGATGLEPGATDPALPHSSPATNSSSPFIDDLRGT